jgi:hypothetical protein
VLLKIKKLVHFVGTIILYLFTYFWRLLCFPSTVTPVSAALLLSSQFCLATLDTRLYQTCCNDILVHTTLSHLLSVHLQPATSEALKTSAVNLLLDAKEANPVPKYFLTTSATSK